MYYYNIFIFQLLISVIYSWNTNYVNISNFQYNNAINFISKINFNNNSVLDIGCGDGKITYYISNISNNKVLGIDKSNILIKYAENNYINNNLNFKNVDILSSNITNIITDKYNTIVSFFCIPWIKNKNIAFSNIAKLSNDNTYIYILASLMEQNHVMLINKLIKKSHWQQYYTNYESPFEYLNDVNYEEYAINSGINTIYKNIFNVYYTFENMNKLRDFNLAILPHIRHLSDENKSKFVDELLDDYFKFINKTDYNITFTIIKFIGYKP
ncbi:unknown similar to AMEV004 [Choristoneura biennis entomopoxvirus]|uniref:Methyltransferase domain-containing protein n=1 Tax=Choristoneura biennis entomopoxvirus TaxID=10288 RepID=A0A916NXL0_CBEPV|nr:unknown similar to AMEV004 [Choristoneura biennis entomopoxvirus]CCU55633.1 unknown similar to AMEV004 [Choristoneura biennis entomopoxvirus]